MSLWESCEPSNEQLSDLLEIENIIRLSSSSLPPHPLITHPLPPISSSSPIPSSISSTSTSSTSLTTLSYPSHHQHNNFTKFLTLVDVEQKCNQFLMKLDEILNILDDISLSHQEITSRTNVLMMNCESLLEQQVDLHTPLSSLFSSHLIS